MAAARRGLDTLLVELSAKANVRLQTARPESEKRVWLMGAANDLGDLPAGRQVMLGIPFSILPASRPAPSAVAVGPSGSGLPQRAGPVLVERRAKRLFVLCAAAGVSDEKIGALEQGADADVFTDIEKDVLRFTDDVVKNDRAGDETFNAMVKHLTPGALVELHLAIGFYIMTSKFLVTFDVDLQS